MYPACRPLAALILVGAAVVPTLALAWPDGGLPVSSHLDLFAEADSGVTPGRDDPQPDGATGDRPIAAPVYSLPPGAFEDERAPDPAEPARAVESGLRITPDATADAYLIRIAVDVGTPEDIRVAPYGNGLAISRTTESRTERTQRSGERADYRHSVHVARTSTKRRLPLPADADLAGMTRELADGAVLLRIPRRGPGSGPPSQPQPDRATASGDRR
jgi:hypothetical protein